MSTLFLIRHGQASLGSDDYDQLSPLGEEQGAHLGRFFHRRGLSFSHVFVGPRRRHEQTLRAASEAMRADGGDLPEASPLPSFDEHQCPEVLDHHHSSLSAAMPGLDPADPKHWLKVFRRGSLMWVRGELDTPAGLEPWTAFRSRVGHGLSFLRQNITDPRARVAVFTSGGTVAAALGTVLGLDHDATIELSWSIRNASVTTLNLSSRGFSMAGFNNVPFTEERLWTYV